MNDCRHARSKQGIQNKRYQWSLTLWESGGFSYKEPNQNQNAQGVGVYSKESHIQDPMRKSKTIAMIHHLRITFTAYYCCANRESNPGQMLGRHLCYHYTIGANNHYYYNYLYKPQISLSFTQKRAVDWPLGAILSHPHSHFHYLANPKHYV